MSKKKLTLKNIIRRCICMISIIMIFNSFTNTAFAASLFGGAGLGGNSGPLATVYKIFVGLSIPVAVLGVAMCAIGIMTGGEESLKKAKKNLINIGIALVTLMLIPHILIFSINSISNGRWTPNNSDTEIIRNAFDESETGNMANEDPLQ